MESRSLKPYLTVIVLMVLACLALAFGVDVTLTDQPGVRMSLPDQLGPWHGHMLLFCHTRDCQKEWDGDKIEDPEHCPDCGGDLMTMSLPEYEQLPKDTRFVKMRYDRTNHPSIFVSIVLSGSDQNTSLHRPQRCLVGQGFTIVGTHVLKVPIEGQPPLTVMLLDNVKNYRAPDGRTYDFWSYYAYWFVGRDRETPYHVERMFWQAWDRIFRNTAHRWAYVAVSGHTEKGSDAYRKDLQTLIAQLEPQLVLYKR